MSPVSRAVVEAGRGSGETRVLLALLKWHARREEFIAPFATTQDGISETTGIARPNVSVTLKRMLSRKLVAERVAHVEGEQRTKKVYFLTSSGHEQARRLAQAEVEYVSWPPGLATPDAFVGREREMKELLRGVREERKRPLFVRGLPGIGKTTLLLRLIEKLRGSMHIFYFRFHEWTSVAHLLREISGFLAALGRGGLSAYLGSCSARGASIDPGIAVAEMGRDLGGQRTVLVFDDVHEAPAPVASLLGGMVETAERVGARVVAAGRHPSAPLDQRALAGRRVREIVLDGLGPEETLELARKRAPERDLDARQGERLRKATGGNPLFIELLAEGDPGVAGGSLVGFIRKEVESRLSARSLALARRLSAFRSPVPEAAFAGRGDGEGLADLVSRSLVTRDPSSGLCSMHETVRDAIYQGIPEEERRAVHARAASRLVSSSDADAALEAVYHLWESGDRRAAGELMLRTGEVLLRTGHGPALLPYLGDGLVGDAAARLLTLRGRAQREAGDARAAAESYRAAREASNAPIDRARASALLANVLVLLDDHEGARAACEAGLLDMGRCAPSRDRDRIRLSIQRELGSVHFLRGDLEGAARCYEDALRGAVKAADLAEIVPCRNNLAAAYSRLGRLAEAAEQMRRAVATPGALEDAWLAPLLLDNTSVLEIDNGEYDAALVSGGKALRTAERMGNELRMISTLNNLGTLHSNRGEFPVAEACFARALALAKKLENEQWKGWVSVSFARTCLVMGQAGRALALIAPVEAVVQSAGDRRLVHVAARARAQAHALLGEEAECREALRECARTLKDAGGARLGAEIPLTEALLLTRLGRAGMAAEAARRAVEILTTEPGDPFDEARAREILAEALRAAGKKEEAGKEYAAAGALYGRIGNKDAAARCARGMGPGFPEKVGQYRRNPAG